MSERDKLIGLLEEVKQKVRMLDAIEERLFLMRDLVIRSKEIEVLNVERQELQSEIDGLILWVPGVKMAETCFQCPVM